MCQWTLLYVCISDSRHDDSTGNIMTFIILLLSFLVTSNCSARLGHGVPLAQRCLPESPLLMPSDNFRTWTSWSWIVSPAHEWTTHFAAPRNPEEIETSWRNKTHLRRPLAASSSPSSTPTRSAWTLTTWSSRWAIPRSGGAGVSTDSTRFSRWEGAAFLFQRVRRSIEVWHKV